MKRPANALSLAVLTLLFEKPMHPYEMSTTLRHRSKEESIRLNYGSLYAVVESLRKKGLIAARETLREGNRPERTVYELTDDGATAMREWLSEMLRDPTPQFTDFEAALSLMGAIPPDEALALLKLRLKALRITSNQYDGVRANLPEGFPDALHGRGRLLRGRAPCRDRVRREARRRHRARTARRHGGVAAHPRAQGGRTLRRGGHRQDRWRSSATSLTCDT